MVVQPSSLTQPQMDNLVAAVKKGMPTAIFEDPMPVMMKAPGTSQPKPPRGGMMGMGAPPEPKGDIQALWNSAGDQDGRQRTVRAFRRVGRLAGLQSVQEGPRVPTNHQRMGLRESRSAGR